MSLEIFSHSLYQYHIFLFNMSNLDSENEISHLENPNTDFVSETELSHRASQPHTGHLWRFGNKSC